jgi:hypothetical protein
MEGQNTQPLQPENQVPVSPTPASTGPFVGGDMQTPVNANSLISEQKKPKRTKLSYLAVISLVVIVTMGVILYFTVFNKPPKSLVSNTSTTKSTQSSAKIIKSADGKVSVTIPSTWIVLPDKPGSTTGTEITDTTKSGDQIYLCDKPGVYTIPSLAQTCNYAVSFVLPSKTEDFFDLSIWYNNLTPAQTIQSEVLSTKAPTPVIVSQNNGTTTDGYTDQYTKYYTEDTLNKGIYISYVVANKGYVAVFSWHESELPINTSAQDPIQIYDYSNLAPEVTSVVNSLVLNF